MEKNTERKVEERIQESAEKKVEEGIEGNEEKKIEERIGGSAEKKIEERIEGGAEKKIEERIRGGAERKVEEEIEGGAEKRIEKKSRRNTKKETEDERFMREALRQAKKAYAIDEVPIGCIIVRENKIIARGYNKRNQKKSALAHAELLAIQKASKVTGDWRLEDCTLYVTLEPCQMCAGAIVQARMKRVVVGSKNPKAGCAGSVLNLLAVEEFNHQPELVTGVLEEACSRMLSTFFKELREKKRRGKDT